MSADYPIDALRLLAGLIAGDLRAGSPALAKTLPSAEEPVRRRGRPKSVPYAVAATPLARAA